MLSNVGMELKYWRCLLKSLKFPAEIIMFVALSLVRYLPPSQRSAITHGRILVNHERVDVSYRIKNGDLLTHVTHLHEPSVLYQPITVRDHFEYQMHAN